VVGSLLEGDELAAAWQRDRVVKGRLPAQGALQCRFPYL
jgi:hypothetical protein